MKPCKIPFHSLTVTPTGKISPCCSYIGDFGSLSDIPSIHDHWKNHTSWNEMRQRERKGVWTLPGCSSCQKREGLVLNRKELFEQMIEEMPGFNPKASELKHVDISFGNACNLTCVMCKGEFSTSWIKADQEFSKEHEWRHSAKPWSMSYEQIDSMVEGLKQVEAIEIKGGEPMFDKKFKYFLQKMLPINKSFRLFLVTNFTIIDPELLRLLAEIKDLNLVVSIDGVGRTYDWVRGFSFSKLEENFDKHLRQVVPYDKPCLFQFTSSVYNLNNIDEFWDWSMQLGERTGVCVIPNFSLIAEDPLYVSPLLLKNKEVIIKKIAHVKQQALAYSGERYGGFWPENSKKIVADLEILEKFLLQGTFQGRGGSHSEESVIKSHNIWHQHLVEVRGWDFGSPGI